MKTMSVGKSLKKFSCAEIRDKKALGENADCMQGFWCQEFGSESHLLVLLYTEWPLIHTPATNEKASTCTLVVKILFESSLLPAYKEMDKVCKEVV